jgi:hypothetical protein
MRLFGKLGWHRSLLISDGVGGSAVSPAGRLFILTERFAA